jgi:hypothetical protein
MNRRTIVRMLGAICIAVLLYLPLESKLAIGETGCFSCSPPIYGNCEGDECETLSTALIVGWGCGDIVCSTIRGGTYPYCQNQNTGGKCNDWYECDDNCQNCSLVGSTYCYGCFPSTEPFE